MHHQSETIKLFIKHNNQIKINEVGSDFHFEAIPNNNPPNCGMQKCENCTFSKAKFCFITPDYKEHAEILAYFKTNHPEKLL